MTLILSKSQVRSVISMKECITAVEEAFKEYSGGTARMPTRVSIPVPDDHGWMGVMPAYLSVARSLTTKIVTVYPTNEAERRMPSVLATVVLNDVKSGRAEAILEGTYITAMRTGAVSGVATKFLARPDANVVGIFGAGVQARKQVEAVREVRNIHNVLVYDTIPKRAQDFVAELSNQSDLEPLVASTPGDVVRRSDIIVTASTSTHPVFSGRDMREGTHVNAVGSFTPTSREVDDETVSSCKIVVDSLDAALAEAGDLIIPLKEGVIRREDILAELGEIITGKKSGRTSELEKTLFKSVGLGIQDAAVARLVFEKAKSLGVGTHFDFEK